MGIFSWVVAVGLAVLLFAFTVYAGEVGGSRTPSGSALERVRRRVRHGLAVRRRRLRHVWRLWSGAVHLGHGHGHR